MRIGLMGHDRFLERIIAAVIGEDQHSLFHSRYWSVFEAQAKQEHFAVLIYLCPVDSCPFAETRCMKLTRTLRVPSVLLFHARRTFKRDLHHDPLFHLVEIPFYPIDLLMLMRQLLKRPSNASALAIQGTHAVQLEDEGPIWERDVELAPGLRFDRTNICIIAKGFRIHLSPREGRLLDMLLQHEGQVVLFEDLFHSVWQDEEKGSFDNLYVIVRSIKKKLQWHYQGAPQELIQNVYGCGYRIDLPILTGDECSCIAIENQKEW